MGRLPDDALLFTDLDGKPRSLYAVSSAWGSFAGRIGMPDVTFHALRHTHASQLIDAGVDIVTISKRLSHDLGRNCTPFRDHAARACTSASVTRRAGSTIR
jgi:integrase